MLLAAALLAHAVAAVDDPVVTKAAHASTIAEIRVGADAVRVQLEIGSRDFVPFAPLLALAAGDATGDDAVERAAHLATFWSDGWVVRADGGPPIPGEVVELTVRRRLVRDVVTGEPLAVQPEDAEPVVFARLSFALADRPSTLSFGAPSRTNGGAAANVGFVALHGGIPVNDFRYLSGEPVLELDWDDPWFSRFDHPNLRRKHEAPLAVFLYVEPFEIRVEVIARPRDLQQWVDLGVDGADTIHAADQAEMLDRIGAFLIERCPLVVDGERVPLELDRAHFVRRSLTTTGVVDPPEDLDANSGTAGVILVWPCDGLPERASVRWDLFHPKFPSVPAAAADEAGGLPSTLTAEDDELVWQNFLTNPSKPAFLDVEPPQPATLAVPVISLLSTVVALALLISGLRGGPGRDRRRRLVFATVAVALAFVTRDRALAPVAVPFASRSVPAPDEARTVLGALLHNVYRSFDRRDESVVYDRLSRSVAGDLLTDVYLETRRSLELQNQGGARVRVDTVDVESAEPSATADGEGIAVRTIWTAAGSVGHWGHVHRRVNRYEADLTIRPIDGAWRISGLELLDERRL